MAALKIRTCPISSSRAPRRGAGRAAAQMQPIRSTAPRSAVQLGSGSACRMFLAPTGLAPSGNLVTVRVVVWFTA